MAPPGPPNPGIAPGGRGGSFGPANTHANSLCIAQHFMQGKSIQSLHEGLQSSCMKRAAATLCTAKGNEAKKKSRK